MPRTALGFGHGPDLGLTGIMPLRAGGGAQLYCGRVSCNASEQLAVKTGRNDGLIPHLSSSHPECGHIITYMLAAPDKKGPAEWPASKKGPAELLRAAQSCSELLGTADFRCPPSHLCDSPPGKRCTRIHLSTDAALTIDGFPDNATWRETGKHGKIFSDKRMTLGNWNLDYNIIDCFIICPIPCTKLILQSLVVYGNAGLQVYYGQTQVDGLTDVENPYSLTMKVHKWLIY